MNLIIYTGARKAFTLMDILNKKWEHVKTFFVLFVI